MRVAIGIGMKKDIQNLLAITMKVLIEEVQAGRSTSKDRMRLAVLTDVLNTVNEHMPEDDVTAG